MKILRWFYVLLAIVLVTVILVFALSNREFVTIDLWPFERTWSPRLSLVVLYALGTGFVAGMVFMWFNSGGTRDKKRRYHHRARHLERELAYVKRKLAEHDRKPALPAAAPGSAPDQAPAAQGSAPGHSQRRRPTADGGSAATRMAARSLPT